MLDTLCAKVDRLIVGGGIANTFLAASGMPVGKSLVEAELVEEARRLMGRTEVPLPEDVVVATALSEDAVATVKDVNAVGADDMILDIGPRTAARFAQLLTEAGTILWNGPVGVFEIRAVRRRHAGDCTGGGRQPSIFARGRRRYARRDGEIRRRR